MPTDSPRRKTLTGLLAAWAAAVAAGFGLLTAYETAPGEPAAAPPAWPADSRIAPDPARPNLVVAAHPRCPCTHATLEELDRVLTRCPGKARVRVLFLRPAGAPAGWEQTDLWRRAAAIPGVEVLADVGGAEARRFGARTSGHALLFDAGGRLLFSGGITGSRGHAGDNAGAASVRTILSGGPAPGTAPVFGCPLQAADPPDGEVCDSCEQ